MEATLHNTNTLWQATATPRPPALGRRIESEATDVLVIGGGFVGLSTALHLAERNIRVTLLEARHIGWGASGRTGGQVIAGLKHDPDHLKTAYPDAAEEMIQLSGNAPSVLFDLIDRHRIQCDAFRGGWLQPAHSEKALEVVATRREQWARHGVASTVLSRSETARRLGTDVYHGAWLDHRGGNIQPLSYCHGLAAAALALGVKIFENARVGEATRNGSRWTVMTTEGIPIDADQVVVCTNAYTDDVVPKLKESFVAANSFQVATYPLPEKKRASILPGGISASDTRNLLVYFRKDAHGRFVLGGRGPFGDASSPRDFHTIIEAVKRIYPALAEERFEFRWKGRVALTRDFMPKLHASQPGLYSMVGFNGRGVALTTTMGRDIARIVAGEREVNTHPFYAKDISPIPFPWLKRFYISSAVLYYRLKDRLI